MTQNEFVKKESEAYYVLKIEGKTFHFDDGLTKGLEIAKELLCWADQSWWNRYEIGGDTWYNFQNMEVKTTDELLTIFLTEKYGK